MLYAGLIAIGFVLGVVNTVLFGKRIVALAVADVKGVTSGTGWVVSATLNRIERSVGSMEQRLDALHAKVDVVKMGTLAAAQNAKDALAKKL